ncbi:uncharacterized protein clcf1 [Entelurus aequoreus]|uniref:uncharacterized protein clcf1 n=1 Tax=Entelurus aequoreus TaxID=161455 RepID=UPI002B1D0246|nr:uncharacterized protein clcf1 [Entelurus aequoreus]
MTFCKATVHQSHRVFLLAVAMATAVRWSHGLASERSSIERTYELTKYLEYQLKEIKDVYLTYLGAPFNEKDFSPPRPNSSALSLPSAATRLELWHGLENQARLAQNQKAYSVLLAAVRELARSTLCPSLRTSLLHFCIGLDGLLGSISALMTTLGYALPPSLNPADQYPQSGLEGDHPAPLVSRSSSRTRTRTRTERRSDAREVRGEDVKRRKAAAAAGRSGGSGEKRRRGRRDEAETWMEEEEAGGGRRRLLSISEDEEEGYTYNVDTLREEDGGSILSHLHHRPPRSLLFTPTLQPPSFALALLHREGRALSPSSPSSTSVLLAVRPAMNDFARKVEGFWVLRELQSWLWRSAKDFNRLKRRLRG